MKKSLQTNLEKVLWKVLSKFRVKRCSVGNVHTLGNKMTCHQCWNVLIVNSPISQVWNGAEESSVISYKKEWALPSSDFYLWSYDTWREIKLKHFNIEAIIITSLFLPKIHIRKHRSNVLNDIIWKSVFVWPYCIMLYLIILLLLLINMFIF